MNVALRADHLDILSLCTGGGGLDLGFQLAIESARTVCMVEREAFAASRLVSAMEKGLLHPAPVWSNARSFDGRAWRGCVDGLIGGIPCQGHSLAGKKRGSLDDRDLWSPTRRIIVQARPWFVLIENVSGMLSPGDDDIAGAERVWRDLRKLGFAVEGGLFTASEVGASHERERIFILGVADRNDKHDTGSGNIGPGWRRESTDSSLDVADTGDARSQGSERRGASEKRVRPASPRPASELRRSPLVDAVSGRYDGRTNDQIGRQIERNVAEGSSGADFGSLENPSIERGGSVPIRSGRQDEAHTDFDRPSLFPPAPGDIDAWREVIARAPELEPSVRRMADGMASRVDSLRMLGNGVVPLQAAYAIRTLATRLANRGSAGAARLVRMMTP